MNLKEIAKFLSGFETFHTLVHGYLLISGTVITVLGVTTTPTLNLFSTLFNLAITIALGWYAWRTKTRG